MSPSTHACETRAGEEDLVFTIKETHTDQNMQHKKTFLSK